MSEFKGKLKTLSFLCELNPAPRSAERSEEPYDGVINTYNTHKQKEFT